MSDNPIVYIIDDDEAVRSSLSMVLQTENLNTRTFGSAVEFLDRYERTCAGCVLMDIRMPDINGFELFRKFRELNIKLPVIFMTGYADIPTAVKAIRAGAMDFIEKPFDHKELLARIHECINESLTATGKDVKQKMNGRLGLLTPRELEVMELMVEGKINKVIADELGISVRTVEAHRANLMEKLEANTLAEVVRLAISSKE